MLCYRGLLPIGKVNSKDIDQIIRDLDLCKMSYYQAKARCRPSLSPDREDGTLEEWDNYYLVIHAIQNFLKGLKKNRTDSFDNPPIVFAIVDDKVYIYQNSVKRIELEIVQCIYELVPKNKVEVKNEAFVLGDLKHPKTL